MTGSGCLLVVRDEFRDALRRLGADGEPVIETFSIKAKGLFLSRSQRVKKPKALKVSTIALISAVSDYDVIERPLLGSAARQSNYYHELFP